VKGKLMKKRVSPTRVGGIALLFVAALQVDAV